jgi:branched-chain amino acid transport system substrate-binding protein
MNNRGKTKILLIFLILLLLLTSCSGEKPLGEPVNIGLIAPLTGSLASSGEAIQRGILLAMDEINEKGGVLGRPVQLVVRDVQNNPEKGIEALRDLAEKESITAVFGGIFSPVMIAQLDTLKELEIPLINPWGSMTAITKNGQNPNYAFRVSVSDEQADEFLVRYAIEILNVQRPGIIVDTSGWGEANLAGLLQWLGRIGVETVGTARFDQGETDMTNALRRLKEAGADSLLMVANAAEGASIVRSRALLGWDIPVISHWGISGGNFAVMAGINNIHDVYTLQTFSFFGDLSLAEQELLQAYNNRFGTLVPEEISSPVGVAHGYDGMHLLAMAIELAGSTKGRDVQKALENLGEYKGLVKTYYRPFTPGEHDALLAEDYIMTQWSKGHLIPAGQPGLQGKG